MTNKIWLDLRKKERNRLSIPSNQTKKALTTSTPTSTSSASPKTTVAQKPVKVKPHKVKKVKAKAQVQQVQQTQKQPQYDLSDFSLSTNADANNIHITTMYQGQDVHAFTLPSIEYANWQRANFQQKYVYVLSKTNLIAFNNDFRMIQPVIIKTIQILDALFARSQAQMAHQTHVAQQQTQQAQRRM
jgi:hypothetical protein